MTQYYFLSIILGPLALDLEPEVNFNELKQLCFINLSPPDQEQFRLFLTWIDLNNLGALWSGQNVNLTGNWSKEELIDMQKQTLLAPGFIEQFLQKYSDDRDRALHFDELLLSYFSYAYSKATGFLKDYLRYEQVLRVIIAAKRAVKLKQSFEDELQLLDPTDPWQAELSSLAHGEPDVLGTGAMTEEAVDLYESSFQSPIELFKQLLLLRFEKIDQLKQNYSPFSIDAVIAYAAGLELVNKWQMTRRTINQSKVMTILKGLEQHE